jgi:hypothetical protein
MILVGSLPDRLRRLEPRAHVRLEECRAERGEDESIEPGWLSKAYLHLGRMDVDIDHVSRHLE